MTQAIEKAYLELPGDRIDGNWMRQNLIMLHEHRDVFIKIDLPQGVLFRLSSPDRAFYSPKIKKQCTEYSFTAGEEVHVWLAKSHQTPIVIQRWYNNDWTRYSAIDPSQCDGADYSRLLARPAPIIFMVSRQGTTFETLIKPPPSEMTLDPEYQGFQRALLQEEGSLQADGSADKDALKRKWEEDKFPVFGGIDVRSCHVAAPGLDPECTCFVEIQPSTEMFRLLPSHVSDLPNKELSANLSHKDEHDSRITADGLIATLGQVADKQALVRDLVKTRLRIVVQEIEGVVKKFVIFSGYPATRHFITGTRYGVANAKVVTVTASQLTMKELAEQSARGVSKLAKPALPGALVLVGLLVDTAQWLVEGHKEVENLFAKYTITIGGSILLTAMEPFIAAAVGLAVKATFGAALKAVATTEVITAAAAATTASVIVAVGVGFAVIVIGVLIGAALSSLYEKGLTDFYKQLEDQWDGLMEGWSTNIADIPDNSYSTP
jgi:hypothetical protein